MIKFLIFLLLVVGAGAVIVALHQKKTETAMIEAEVKAAADAANDAAKTRALAANAIDQAACMTTNIVPETKQNLEGSLR